MALENIISVSGDDRLDFGNYKLDSKTKLSNFEFKGDLYKVKTFKEITKLEKNELFVYESVPGTNVTGFYEQDDVAEFDVTGYTDTQITLELLPDHQYNIFVDGNEIGSMMTNLGGKLVIGLEFDGSSKHVKIVGA